MPDQHRYLPAYEKDLIGLVKAIKHWRPYVWGLKFLVRTDHYSLKFLLEQKVLSPLQQHWFSKLMGFTFSVEYKAGRQNIVADSLSCREEDNSSLMAICMPQLCLFDEIQFKESSNSLLKFSISSQKQIVEV